MVIFLYDIRTTNNKQTPLSKVQQGMGKQKAKWTNTQSLQMV